MGDFELLLWFSPSAQIFRVDTLGEALGWMQLVADALQGKSTLAEVMAQAGQLGGADQLQQCMAALDGLRQQSQQSYRLAVSSSMS